MSIREMTFFFNLGSHGSVCHRDSAAVGITKETLDMPLGKFADILFHIIYLVTLLIINHDRSFRMVAVTVRWVGLHV